MPRKGYKQSEEHKHKIGIALIGRPKSEEHRKKITIINRSPEKRAKNSLVLREKHISPKTEFKYGHKRGMTNKKHSSETRQKISFSHKGEKCYLWKGGISRLPYPFDFNDELKELIRKRDNYKCQLCGCPQEECLQKLDVHHIDFGKNNLDPNNLISLCRRCHSKTKREEQTEAKVNGKE